MKRAIVYARVSTHKQAVTGYSLNQQLDAGHAYAQSQHMTLVASFQDTISGRTSERPGLNQAIAMIEQGEAEALIVFTPDRLFRDRLHFRVLRRRIQAAGANIHYASTGRISGHSSHDQLSEDDDARIAEAEIVTTLERVRRGVRAKAETGQYVGLGSCPYGYNRIGKGPTAALEVCEEEAEVVGTIFTWFTSGIGVVEIMQRLNTAAIPSPGERYGRVKIRGHAEWNNSTIYRMLQNPTYMGTAYAFRYKRGGQTYATIAPKDQWIPTRVPAIIDKAIFEAVQHMIAAGRRPWTGLTGRQCLLVQHITCACGYWMSARQTKAKHHKRLFFYYKCNGGNSVKSGARFCPMRSVPAERLDAVIWDWTVRNIDNEQQLARLIQIHKEREHHSLHTIDNVRRSLEAERDAVQARLLRAREAYTAGVFTLDEYREYKTSTEAERMVIDQRVIELEQRIPPIDTIAGVTAVQRLMHTLRTGSSLSFDEQRFLIEVLDVRVVMRSEPDTFFATVSSALHPDGEELHFHTRRRRKDAANPAKLP